MTTEKRLHMTLGEAIFTQRAIRRLRTDPIPASDLHDILKAATRAPNGGNGQPWHFLVVRDPLLRSKLGKLYHEAWWAKRIDEGINGYWVEEINPPEFWAEGDYWIGDDGKHYRLAGFRCIDKETGKEVGKSGWY